MATNDLINEDIFFLKTNSSKESMSERVIIV
jgi:hypothetical protein